MVRFVRWWRAAVFACGVLLWLADELSWWWTLRRRAQVMHQWGRGVVGAGLFDDMTGEP